MVTTENAGRIVSLKARLQAATAKAASGSATKAAETGTRRERESARPLGAAA
jgi:hypothetical protein